MCDAQYINIARFEETGNEAQLADGGRRAERSPEENGASASAFNSRGIGACDFETARDVVAESDIKWAAGSGAAIVGGGPSGLCRTRGGGRLHRGSPCGRIQTGAALRRWAWLPTRFATATNGLRPTRRAKGAAPLRYAGCMSIEQRHDSRSAGHPAKPSTARRFIVLGRWALVAAGIVAIALGFAAASPVVRFAAFAGLSFLLANALWQHMPLSQACAAAAAIAIVFGAAVALYRLFAWGMGLESWLPDALGAVVGALVAYPALKRIDHISPDGL